MYKNTLHKLSVDCQRAILSFTATANSSDSAWNPYDNCTCPFACESVSAFFFAPVNRRRRNNEIPFCYSQSYFKVSISTGKWPAKNYRVGWSWIFNISIKYKSSLETALSAMVWVALLRGIGQASTNASAGIVRMLSRSMCTSRASRSGWSVRKKVMR